MPRASAAAPPRRRDPTASGAPQSAESFGRTRAARSSDPRQPSRAQATGPAHSTGVFARAPHAGRAAVQQPAGAVSLFRLRAAGGRAPEVSGESTRAGDCVPGLVERATASQAAGPLPGLERGSARAQRASAGLQHAFSDPAVGPGAALGLAYLGPYGEAGFPRLATNL